MSLCSTSFGGMNHQEEDRHLGPAGLASTFNNLRVAPLSAGEDSRQTEYVLCPSKEVCGNCSQVRKLVTKFLVIFSQIHKVF